MGIERSLFCDECGTIIASSATIKRVKQIARGECGADVIRGRDICKACQPKLAQTSP